ncbi:MAG: competence protein CoiA family protein, partial [Bacteroidota bacterium]
MPFRAIHAETRVDHILWEATSDETVDAWRKLGQRQLLRCPTCGGAMRVRAGSVYTKHFAHFHRVDCPADNDTPELRAARMALYLWLRPKVEARGGTATIEDWVPESGLPRPIDVHVRFEDGKPGIAVWLHDRQLGPEKREQLEQVMKSLHTTPRWVFTERMHRPVEKKKDRVNLSTLERDRMEASRFDALGPGEGTLHYLVEGNAKMRTYRGLKLIHAPGTFSGLIREDPLEDVLLTRKGALLHPGELEALKAWETEREALRMEAEARSKREAAERARRWE